MRRRQLFHAADLARALKVAQAAGLIIARIEIEPSGKIVIITQPSSGDDRGDVAAELEALRRRGAERRAAKIAQQGPDPTSLARTVMQAYTEAEEAFRRAP